MLVFLRAHAGKLDEEIHLEVSLDPAVIPVLMPPRRLPVAVKKRVKMKLDEMCRNINEPSQGISVLVG
jgi:hypothetical protein